MQAWRARPGAPASSVVTWAGWSGGSPCPARSVHPPGSPWQRCLFRVQGASCSKTRLWLENVEPWTLCRKPGGDLKSLNRRAEPRGKDGGRLAQLSKVYFSASPHSLFFPFLRQTEFLATTPLPPPFHLFSTLPPSLPALFPPAPPFALSPFFPLLFANCSFQARHCSENTKANPAHRAPHRSLSCPPATPVYLSASLLPSPRSSIDTLTL